MLCRSFPLHRDRWRAARARWSRSVRWLAVALAWTCIATAASAQVSLNFGETDNDGDYLEVPGATPLDLATSTWTVSAWIQPSDWGQNDQGRILDHDGGSSGSAGWTLHVENKGSNGSPSTLRVQINDDSGFNGTADVGAIALDVWQHVAIVFDNGTLTFYVDGLPQGVRTGVPTPNLRGTPVYIGARADANREFEGDIDEVRIWDIARTQSEIQADMAASLTGSEPGLIGYWPIEEGSGQTTADLGPNGYTATLGSTTGVDDNDPTWNGGGGATNQAPAVNAGPDLSILLPDTQASLDATVTDDGLPTPPSLTTTWSVVSGPGAVMFLDANAVDTVATVSIPGTYVLRLTADDGELSVSDDMELTYDTTPSLTTMTVTPTLVGLEPGEIFTFVAEGFDQVGAPFPVSPVWSATGGSIDANGDYLAGSTEGSFQVTATDGAVMATADLSIADLSNLWPTNGWVAALPAEMGLDATTLGLARDYAGGDGMITRYGRVVMTWGDIRSRAEIRSATKSIGNAALGMAIDDGLVNLADFAQTHLPDVGDPPSSNVATGFLDDITIANLATQTAGFDKDGGFIDILYQPGTAWAYSDGGINWLADVLTVKFNDDLNTVMFDRLFTPLGLDSGDIDWRDHQTRTDTINGIKRRELSSGIRAHSDALARFGYLFLQGGEWDGTQILPPSWVAQAGVNQPGVPGLPVLNDNQNRFAGASDHYGLLWWNNADGAMPNVPTDTYWAWGVNDRLVVVMPSLGIVASRLGDAIPGSQNPSYYQVIEPFFENIAQAVIGEPNFPPDVDAGPDASTQLPLDQLALFGTVTDDGLVNPTPTITWSQVGGPAGVTFSDASQPNTVATFPTDGVFVLRLTADDGERVIGDDVVITVDPPDTTPPTGSFVMPLDGALLSGNIPIEVTASDDQAVLVVVFLADGGAFDIDLDPPYTAVWDSSSVPDGPHTLGAVVVDQGNNLAFPAISVTTQQHAPPTVDAGVDQTLMLPTDTVLLPGSVSDDGLPFATLSSLWTVVSGPGSVTFGNDTAATTNATFGAAGTYVLRLTGDDGNLATSDDVTITVEPPTDVLPPTGMMTAPLPGAVLSGTVNLSATLTDPESGVDFAIFLASGMPIALATGSPYDATWDTTTVDDGLYSLGVIAADVAGNYSIIGIPVTVDNGGPTNTAPTANAGSDQDITLPTDSVALSGSVGDDGIPGALTSEWELIAGPSTVTFGDATSPATTATFGAEGTYLLRLTARDGSLETWDDTIVTVDPVSGSAHVVPYPQSTLVTNITWAPLSEVVTAAEGSDTWPITWGDDDAQYTTFGDGKGFTPEPPGSLSLGFTRIDGAPPTFSGTNIPSPTGEQMGGGQSGKKASGMLMVDSVLYMWVRNADNSGEGCELAWSTDYANTWTYSTWQWLQYGYCALLNFGPNYAGARDDFVYMYTPDRPSAYSEGDHAILTRVPKNQILEEQAYQWFSGMNPDGSANWTMREDLRHPVFTLPKGVNRLDVSYNAGLGRYMLVDRSRERTSGGKNQFSIYEAPEPWGPWSLVYYTEEWEGGALSTGNGGWGESQHIPVKWMAPDGRAFFLLYAGDDSFAVREATLTVAGDTNVSPIASFTGTPDTGVAPLLVNFDATASTDPDGTIVSYDWDFGDGNTATGVTTNHTYTAAGTYIAELTLTDDDGAVDSTSMFVTVTGP